MFLSKEIALPTNPSSFPIFPIFVRFVPLPCMLLLPHLVFHLFPRVLHLYAAATPHLVSYPATPQSVLYPATRVLSTHHLQCIAIASLFSSQEYSSPGGFTRVTRRQTQKLSFFSFPFFFFFKTFTCSTRYTNEGCLNVFYLDSLCYAHASRSLFDAFFFTPHDLNLFGYIPGSLPFPPSPFPLLTCVRLSFFPCVLLSSKYIYSVVFFAPFLPFLPPLSTLDLFSLGFVIYYL